MNGYSMMAESYKKAAEKGKIDRETAEKSAKEVLKNGEKED